MSKDDVTPTAETQEAAPVTQDSKPRRARTAGGKLRADDPSTPDVNEAFEQTHTERKAEAAVTAAELSAHEAAARVANSSPRKDVVYYVSANEETVSFDVKVAGEDYSPSWDIKREHLVWRIPKAIAERFEMHSHFTSGRIIRSKEV